MGGGDSGPELTRIKRTHLLVKIQNGFTPIRLDDYIELHLQVNPETNRTELLNELQSAIDRSAVRRSAPVRRSIETAAALLRR